MAVKFNPISGQFDLVGGGTPGPPGPPGPGGAIAYSGSFYDTTTQTIASTTTAYVMTINTTDTSFGVTIA